jgi:Skp family chaperone for outer membrane proteins
MKIVFTLTFTLVFASFAFCQSEENQPVSNKIAVINTDVFYDEKTGIKDLVEANKKLDEEFKPQLQELKLMEEQIIKLEKDIEQLSKPGAVGCRIGILDEYESVAAKYKSKLNEIKPPIEKRKLELTGDINKKIGEAIKQFAKEKGYAVIFDAAILEKGIITDCNGCIDNVTAEFIQYYNSLSQKPQ